MLRKWLDGGGGGRGSLSGFSTWLQHPPPPAHGSPEAGAQFILGRGWVPGGNRGSSFIDRANSFLNVKDLHIVKSHVILTTAL